MAWQKIRIDLPDDLSADERTEVAQSFIDKMVENATNGVGVKGEPGSFTRAKFPAYTKKYEDIKGQKNVDLTLSGEMLSALKVISTKKGSTLIGFDNGSEVNGKAEGNITGSYGKEPDPKKARNFLGLTDREIRAIVNSVKRSRDGG